MARIRGNGHRDTKARSLSQFLEPIMPLSSQSRLGQGMNIEVIQVLARHRSGNRLAERAVLGGIERAIQINASNGMEHQASLLLQRHLAQEICHALIKRATRIFVWIKPTILIQIAEREITIDQEWSVRH
jgi:hypothetical protein